MRLFEPFVHQTEYPGFGYGYGWFVGEFQGHPVVLGAGGGVVYIALIIRYPQYHLTVIVLTNQANIDYVYIWGLISDELIGKE